jgi:hypothetical protein
MLQYSQFLRIPCFSINLLVAHGSHTEVCYSSFEYMEFPL